MSLRLSKKLVVGESGIPTTAGPLTVSVDAAGSDITGDGSVASPYATVERAYEDIPEIIRHECKILVAAGNYASGWPTGIAPVLEDGGSLAIVGVGAPDVITGPWTVTGVADLGTGGQRVTIAAGGLGADDSLCGQFIMIATGGHVDEVHRVAGNTDTTIDVLLVTNKVDNADTLNLVNPAVKIASDGADILYDSVSVAPWDGGTWESKNQRLIIHNIWLDFSASTSAADVLQIRGRQGRGGMSLDFLRVELPATVYGGMVVTECLINSTGAPFSNAYIADGGTGIANLGCHTRVGLSVTGAGDRESAMVYFYGRTDTVDLSVKGKMTCYAGASTAVRFTAGILNLYNLERAYAATFLLTGKAGSVALETTAPDIDIFNGHILLASNAIRLQLPCKCLLAAMTCDPAGVTGSGMTIGAGCTVVQKGALAALLGASAGGDKAFTFEVDGGGVKADIWMAANYGTATDIKGAIIIRQD